MNPVISTIILLIVSNVFMTFAWYGHLKLQSIGTSTSWPLYAVIIFSWGVALFEYCFQVPANRIGFDGNGGPFSLMQLKVMQEVIHFNRICCVQHNRIRELFNTMESYPCFLFFDCSCISRIYEIIYFAISSVLRRCSRSADDNLVCNSPRYATDILPVSSDTTIATASVA